MQETAEKEIKGCGETPVGEYQRACCPLVVYQVQDSRRHSWDPNSHNFCSQQDLFTLKMLLKISKSFSLHGLHVLMSTILEMLRFKILINSLKVLLANSS